jgi:nucleotidyltransferase substrate binding protein (TIGR01987 family)
MAVTTKEFERAVLRLEEALAQPKNDFIRDSVIQRFEFCVELSWKSAKKVFALESAIPKMVFRDLAQQGIIESVDYWFSLIEARNKSSHSYNEVIAEEIYSTAQKSLPHFKDLIKQLQKP